MTTVQPHAFQIHPKSPDRSSQIAIIAPDRSSQIAIIASHRHRTSHIASGAFAKKGD
ncbi:MAG: hypothetical protein NTZ50_01340 [Chloroflexi bacterium]|nr:hypothetical protein [Chloroflexota bacterium]